MTFCSSISTTSFYSPQRTDSTDSKTCDNKTSSFDSDLRTRFSWDSGTKYLSSLIEQQLRSIQCSTDDQSRYGGGDDGERTYDSGDRDRTTWYSKDGEPERSVCDDGYFGDFYDKYSYDGRTDGDRYEYGDHDSGELDEHHDRDGSCGTSEPDTVPSTGDGVTLQIKGLLQGAYNTDTGLMNDALREQSLLPDSQPYAGLGYAGTESLSDATLATTGDDAPVDWVLIELRDKNNPDVVVSSQAAVIQRDGDVANADTNTTDLHFDVPEGDYFVTLAHRNHLDITTTSSISLSGEAGTLVDFTDPNTISNQEFTVVNGQAALWAGDANGDNTVTAFGPGNDADALVSDVLTAPGNTNTAFDYAAPGYFGSDFNLDGFSVYTGKTVTGIY
ncbi:MAG: hypothetical protein R3E89_00580 [Thiolinea sp.]